MTDTLEAGSACSLSQRESGGVRGFALSFPHDPPHPNPLPSPSRMFPTWTDSYLPNPGTPGFGGEREPAEFAAVFWNSL
jgi:hypothetical protein